MSSSEDLSRSRRPSIWPKAAGKFSSLPADRLGFLVVLLGYVLVFGGLIAAGDFIPYVLDGNESFSTLVHARNMFTFSWADSFGLTDESASLAAAAHPVIHTHQGNWPRIFAFVLYVFGARSIESQIILTTFTVGVVAIWFAYRLFLRMGPPLFATVLCLVLITDYILFAQWQLVTYRVWHGFFLFGALLAVHRACERPNWMGLALTVTLFAAIFYYELIFAAFVTVFAGLYALAVGRQAKHVVLAYWGSQILGAMIGATILGMQLIAFMGLEDVLQDAALTLSARNFATDEAQLEEVLRAFYEPRNIAFFFNIVDGNAFRNVTAFLSAFFRYGFQTHGPTLGVAALILTAGLLAGFLGRTDELQPVRPASTKFPRFANLQILVPAIGSVVVFLFSGTGLLPLAAAILCVAAMVGAIFVSARRPSLPAIPAWLAGLTLLAPATALAAIVLRDSAFAGLPPRGVESGMAALAIATLALFAGGTMSAAAVRIAVSLAGPRTLRPIRVAAAAGIFLVAAGLVGSQYLLLDQSLAPIWYGELLPGWLRLPLRIGLLFMAALAATIALAGTGSLFERAFEDGKARALSAYFLCGLAAFAIVLLLAPGYVHSGYLWRYAPFVVFLTDAVIGCAVFVGLGAARTAVRHARLGPVKQGNPAFGSKTVTALAAITPILFAVGWVTGQTVNLRLLPPDSFSFVKALRAPEFQGANSAASNYALPFHDQSGGWSYLDPALLSGRIDLSESGFAIRRDTTYLWFADRATNRDYERPDLFICYISQTFQTALADLQSGLEAGNPWCTTLGIVRSATRPGDGLLAHEIVDRDPGGDKWAILRLDWDFPPYLRPVPGRVAKQPVDARLIADGGRFAVEVTYFYAQQDGKPEAKSLVQAFPILRSGSICRLAETALAQTRVTGGHVRLALPETVAEFVVAVTPRSVSKTGPHWLSQPVREDGGGAAPCVWTESDLGGAIYLRDQSPRKDKT